MMAPSDSLARQYARSTKNGATPLEEIEMWTVQTAKASLATLTSFLWSLPVCIPILLKVFASPYGTVLHVVRIHQENPRNTYLP